jgi:hypothetical protein
MVPLKTFSSTLEMHIAQERKKFIGEPSKNEVLINNLIVAIPHTITVWSLNYTMY